jgi:uncharacterized metal-binding protein
MVTIEFARPSDLPLVFDCAGCSPGGRLAADLAWELDRRGAAELSWLVGVRQRVPIVLRRLKGRETWVIDGCPVACARTLFADLGLRVTRHVQLMDTANRRASTAGLDPKALADDLVADTVAKRKAHAKRRARTRPQEGTEA